MPLPQAAEHFRFRFREALFIQQDQNRHASGSPSKGSCLRSRLRGYTGRYGLKSHTKHTSSKISGGRLCRIVSFVYCVFLPRGL